MHRLTPNTPSAERRAIATHIAHAPLIIIGAGWIDVPTPGELQRQLRRQRIRALNPGIYVATHGDPVHLRQTLEALVVLDVPRFSAACVQWDRESPSPPAEYSRRPAIRRAGIDVSMS